ncbi:MAG: hypothetical protein FWE14_00815 [Lachnospiraceae bacterium]|nr:hypothetical protein [Lachnospiraceae bacterium]
MEKAGKKLDIPKLILRKIIRPLYYKSRGWGSSLKYHEFIVNHEYESIETNTNVQKERLYRLIHHAVTNIPYYKQIAEGLGFSYTKETIFEDLKKLPVLTKEKIRKAGDDMMWPEYDGFLQKNSSGGSTGEAIKLWQDKRYLYEVWTEYSNSLGNFEFGERNISLWGSERDIIAGTESFKVRFFNKFFYRTKMLNTFRMSEEEMFEFVHEMNKFKPKAIIAYAQSAYELACFIEKKGLSIHSPRGIICSAGNLYPEMRMKIEAVFGTKAVNRYGSREVGNMATECECQEGLHLNIFGHYLEILNEKGEEVKDGEQGEIYVTLLTNYAMPLIRYQIGDMAVKTSRLCSCKRGWPLLESVTGRTVGVFKTKTGTLVDGIYFNFMFFGVDFIHRFQVIQEDYLKVSVNMVIPKKPSDEVWQRFCDDVRRRICLVLGDDCDIIFKIVSEIEPLASGKYMYTISKVK